MSRPDVRLMLAGILVLCTGLVAGSPTTTAAFAVGDGSTVDLEKIVLARCRDYTRTRYLEVLPRPSDSTCVDIAAKFFKAFKSKAPCTVTQDDYADFFEATYQDLPANKNLFWSRVYALAHTYNNNGNRYVTLEDTLVGYLVNSLNWCGQVAVPGINYDECPAWNACELQATGSFWATASEKFAQAASGEVTVMLDGSNPDRQAYAEGSFFRTKELPNLTSNVTSVKVLLSHSLGRKRIESCGTGSLAQLEKDAKAKGFAYSCEDSPSAVVHLLCSNQPQMEECELDGTGSAPSTTVATGLLALTTLMASLAGQF